MNRRKFIGTATGVTAAATIGGAALTGVGSADAHADTDYTVGTVELASDTGEIDYVAMHGEGTLEWIGLDTPATEARILTYATAYGPNNDELIEHTQINDTGTIDLSDGAEWGNHNDELSGEGTRGYIHHGVGRDENGEHDPSDEWVIVGDKPGSVEGSDYGLPENSLDADPFSVDDNGTEERFYVVLETEYLLMDGSGQLIETATEGDIQISIENIDSDADTAGDDEDSGASGGTSNDGETAGEVFDEG